MASSKRRHPETRRSTATQDRPTRKGSALQRRPRPPGGRRPDRRRFWVLTGVVASALVLTLVALWTRHPRPSAPAASSEAVASPPLSPEEQALRTAVARQPGDPQARMALGQYLM